MASQNNDNGAEKRTLEQFTKDMGRKHAVDYSDLELMELSRLHQQSDHVGLVHIERLDDGRVRVHIYPSGQKNSRQVVPPG